MSNSVHFEKRFALLLILDGAELGSVDRAVWGELHSHGIGATDVANGGLEQIGTFSNGPANQDSAGAGARASEFLRIGITLF
jgi:hypothetical protein